MQITTKQAGHILNVSPATVASLIKKGLLTDHGHTTNGRQRHAYVLDQAEVKALRAGGWQPRQGHTAAALPPTPEPTRSPTPPPTETGGPQAIRAQLARIEGKIDQLLHAWS